jgi:glycosyltransferase involved in cell wall biosynthesis
VSARPLVTVAMPLYNAAAHLEQTLHAIRNQTYRDLDILLCDDASTDATPEICAAAARDDGRVRVVRNAKNLGMVGNFNAAIPLKRGELFMWAGQDDERAPTFVERTVDVLVRNPRASLAVPWTTLITPEGERLHRPYSDAIASDDLPARAAAFVADTQTVAIYGLYRASVIDAIGPMDPWLDTDRHYLFKALIRGPFVVVPEPLFRYTLIHGADYYERLGFPMRPGATDYDLDLYRHFPSLMREAGVDRATIARARAAMMVPLRPYLDRRADFLIGQLLEKKGSLRTLFAYANQYPPLYRRRIFWGAVRRLL